jgi:hypothetical protein
MNIEDEVGKLLDKQNKDAPIPYSRETQRVIAELQKKSREGYTLAPPIDALAYYASLLTIRETLALLASKHHQYRDFHRWIQDTDWCRDRIEDARRSIRRRMAGDNPGDN